MDDQTNLDFLKECEAYIKRLTKQGRMLAAQPLHHEAIRLVKNGTQWAMEALKNDGDVQVGYYLIRADSIEEAMDIAKDNPEFAFVPAASVEVRQVKSMEERTGFIYPAGIDV